MSLGLGYPTGKAEGDADNSGAGPGLGVPWRYHIDDRHLTADRLFGRRRIKIPWTDIREVRRRGW